MILQFLWGGNLGAAQLGGSGLRSVTRLQSRYRPGLLSSEVLTAARGLTFKGHSLTWLQAGGLGFSPRDLSIWLRECPHNMAAFSSQERGPRRSHDARYDPVLPSLLPHSVCQKQSVSPALVQREKQPPPLEETSVKHSWTYIQPPPYLLPGEVHIQGCKGQAPVPTWDNSEGPSQLQSSLGRPPSLHGDAAQLRLSLHNPACTWDIPRASLVNLLRAPSQSRFPENSP